MQNEERVDNQPLLITIGMPGAYHPRKMEHHEFGSEPMPCQVSRVNADDTVNLVVFPPVHEGATHSFGHVLHVKVDAEHSGPGSFSPVPVGIVQTVNPPETMSARKGTRSRPRAPVSVGLKKR